MPNAAKLGMFVGVALVITIGIVFFRRDVVTTSPAAIPNQSVVVGPVALPRPENPDEREIPGRLMNTNKSELQKPELD